MSKIRDPIPKGVREQVLKEFNHRCAICGADRPHLHHIDEDPANNDPVNLLPLCPNCHLSDQHRPTESIQPRILGLFRRYKDPAILAPQFVPLFQRFEYLYDIDDSTDPDELGAASEELSAFVRALEMGEFYGPKIEELTKRISLGVGSFNMYTGQPDPGTARRLAALPDENRRKLRANKDPVIGLCIELLRYQGWSLAEGER